MESKGNIIDSREDSEEGGMSFVELPLGSDGLDLDLGALGISVVRLPLALVLPLEVVVPLGLPLLDEGGLFESKITN
ncbi:hypothetical protein ABG067_009388, partial [Albugo candida]